MNSFVESCVETVSGSAVSVERHTRGRPRAKKLLALLAHHHNILITTHEHPDPDALASTLGLCTLLSQKLPHAQVSVSVKGRIGGGLNSVFVQQTHLKVVPWDEKKLKNFDAILLLDTQPSFAYSPLPPSITPLAVIDHHRPGRGRRPKCGFCDIRSEVGATASIIFSYFMELDVPIAPDLAATLLYAIESDLAGIAGAPSELDNIALSSLTLKADNTRLYKMRYVDLPQSYFIAYASGLASAVYYDDAIAAYLGPIDSLEKPAIIADFLLRFDQVQWSLVTGLNNNNLIISIRTSTSKITAATMMTRVLRGIGEGGGHRTKAGGVVRLENGSPTEVERIRAIIRQRYLRTLGIKHTRGQRLIPVE